PPSGLAWTVRILGLRSLRRFGRRRLRGRRGRREAFAVRNRRRLAHRGPPPRLLRGWRRGGRFGRPRPGGRRRGFGPVTKLLRLIHRGSGIVTGVRHDVALRHWRVVVAVLVVAVLAVPVLIVPVLPIAAAAATASAPWPPPLAVVTLLPVAVIVRLAFG